MLGASAFCRYYSLDYSYLDGFVKKILSLALKNIRGKLNFVEFRPRSVEKINFLYILSLKLDIIRSFIRIFAAY
jgi:hypothetical protein